MKRSESIPTLLSNAKALLLRLARKLVYSLTLPTMHLLSKASVISLSALSPVTISTGRKNGRRGS